MPSPKKPPVLRKGRPNTQRTNTDVVLREDQPPVPKPPIGLLDKSRKRWRSYWESHVARVVDPTVDLHRVERWIQYVDEWDRMVPILRKSRLVKGSAGQLVMNPLAGYLKQLEDNIARAEETLGLTPRARLQLGIEMAQAKKAAKEMAHSAYDELDAGDDHDDPRLVLVS